MDDFSVFCSECGLELKENTSCPADGRKPCPVCGSKTRKFHAVLRDTITFKEKLRMKGRHAGGGRPFIDQVSGDDLHRKSGKWMKLSRIIDRDNDIYREVVTDPETGNVIHECKEPLSKHRGYGSAKRKLKKKSGYRDRSDPHRPPLPHHAAYGSVLRDSADQAESDPGEHKPK